MSEGDKRKFGVVEEGKKEKILPSEESIQEAVLDGRAVSYSPKERLQQTKHLRENQRIKTKQIIADECGIVASDEQVDDIKNRMTAGVIGRKSNDEIKAKLIEAYPQFKKYFDTVFEELDLIQE